MPCALTIRWLGSNDFHLLHPVRSAALTCLKTKNEKCREVQGFPPSCPSVEELRPRPNESKPEYVWPKPMRRQSMVPVDFKIVRGRCGEPTYFVAPRNTLWTQRHRPRPVAGAAYPNVRQQAAPLPGFLQRRRRVRHQHFGRLSFIVKDGFWKNWQDALAEIQPAVISLLYYAWDRAREVRELKQAQVAKAHKAERLFGSRTVH